MVTDLLVVYITHPISIGHSKIIIMITIIIIIIIIVIIYECIRCVSISEYDEVVKYSQLAVNFLDNYIREVYVCHN